MARLFSAANVGLLRDRPFPPASFVEGARELFVQNIRVPKLAGEALQKMVVQEVSSRVPFAAAEAEIRFLEAEDVRQGETVKREIVVLACHRPVLERALAIVEQAGLRPVAVGTLLMLSPRRRALQPRRHRRPASSRCA